jgi:hypothetical protein
MWPDDWLRSRTDASRVESAEAPNRARIALLSSDAPGENCSVRMLPGEFPSALSSDAPQSDALATSRVHEARRPFIRLLREGEGLRKILLKYMGNVITLRQFRMLFDET